MNKLAVMTSVLGAAVLRACGSYSPEVAPLHGATGREFAERVRDVPVENMACLAPGVYRGAQPDHAGLVALRAMGIRTIINLRSMHSERGAAEALGFRVVEIPMNAGLFGSTAPTHEQICQFLGIVTDPACQPVFFHCAYGCDRAGTMAAIYRMQVQGWSNADAIGEMHAFGYHRAYRSLLECVECYECQGTEPTVRRTPTTAAPATP